ncbi:MAG: hypothetical protein ACREBU_02085 [Nitrososphaera sp.]
MRNLSTRKVDPVDDSLPRAIVALKREFLQRNMGAGFLSEFVPLQYSSNLTIGNNMLQSIHNFAQANPIYHNSREIEICSVPCRVYEGDINSYWLSSKKHDTCYQPFYPTWMLSSYSLVLGARSLGFEQVVDIGSGDGRIAYCSKLLGMDSFGIEIDGSLVDLQERISAATGIKYRAIKADATRFDYRTLQLSMPMFFISGLPENGEILAEDVIERVSSIEPLKHASGFNFMGSHSMRAFSRDHTGWGWGSIIARFGLEVSGVVTLPTYWTADQPIDTPYVYTKCR